MAEQTPGSSQSIADVAASLSQEKPDPGTYNLAAVLSLEAAELKKRYASSGDLAFDLNFDDDAADGTGRSPDHFGVCFSGGGIRSACVSLGITQSLARHRLLRQVHYLSAISGGGYFLGCLTAWIKRAPGSFAEVDRALAQQPPAAAVPPSTPTPYPRFIEPDVIRHLRRYSSYLTPRLGLLSGDTLAMASIYLRNFLLNLVMLLSALMALTVAAQVFDPRDHNWLWHPSSAAVLIEFLLIAACFVLAVWKVLRVLFDMDAIVSRQNRALIVRITGFFGCALLWHISPTFYLLVGKRSTADLGWLTVLFMFLGLSVSFFGMFFRPAKQKIKPSTAEDAHDLKSSAGRVHPVSSVTWWGLLFAWLSAGILTLIIALSFAHWLHLPVHGFLPTSYAIFGLPAIFCSFPAISYLFVGVLGDQMPDAEREWLARFAGYFLLYAAATAAVLTISIEGYPWMDALFYLIRHTGWHGLFAALIPGGWIYVVVTGVLGGKSKGNSGNESAHSYLGWIIAIAPTVFIAGLLFLASWSARALKEVVRHYLRLHGRTIHLQSLYLLLVFAVIAYLLSRRLDVNEFSMHLFYRNRLVRAFLGASNINREPNRFTGFAHDDIPLREMVYEPYPPSAKQSIPGRYDGPYPIWGTTLNLTKEEDLAWQERKGASFFYSPLFCGWDHVPFAKSSGDPYNPIHVEVPIFTPDNTLPSRAPATWGFRPTRTYAGEGGKPLLGNAMAASGAAVSPNMGYHTRPGVAALLALFNVRLGWWTGNPRNTGTWCEYAPGAWYLVDELLGSANDESKYVYLSDGGHFENLGLYEMVRRRVRFILCSDAGADPSFGFSDLGNAIERCRRDFGVEIHLQPQIDINLDLNNSPFRKGHYSIGRIEYPTCDGCPPLTGILLYIKSSLTNDEPSDILGLHGKDATFPHDSTANQFFNETLFEAYRGLGQHMMDTIANTFLANSKATTPRDQVRALFNSLSTRIHPTP